MNRLSYMASNLLPHYFIHDTYQVLSRSHYFFKKYLTAIPLKPLNSCFDSHHSHNILDSYLTLQHKIG